ncbi:hypothetical protein FRC02_003148 [Tulasnella sp. 418]|nr:hypothetical protein FRC02_003148 [Tulasnella sp. 418]
MSTRTKRSSGLDFSDGRTPPTDIHPDIVLSGDQPAHLQRNKTERRRLQGLMRTESINNTTPPRAVTPVNTKLMAWKDRWHHWMVNDGEWLCVSLLSCADVFQKGGRQLFFGVWVFLHMLVFAFGFMHYQMKENLSGARGIFGLGFPIARTAALVLHVDVALILLPVCRGFISALRRTALNDFIPFDKNITFHKATAWSIVAMTIVHVVAHMFNFATLAIVSGKSTGERIVLFLQANFLTGPGATGWIMNIILGVMVWFAIEKRRRANFERFW